VRAAWAPARSGGSLDGTAARILSLVTPFSQDNNPGQLTPAGAGLRAFIGDIPGRIVAALHAAGVLPRTAPPPDSAC
jgi:hypothetical protein